MPLASNAYPLGGQLPGLNTIESAIAQAWLAQHRENYDTLEFNVRLGKGTEPHAGAENSHKRYVYSSTTKRADLVLTRGQEVTIVEIKQRISGGVLGQLHTYAHLYQAEHPAAGPIHLIAAGQSIQSDIQPVFDKFGIAVELFPHIFIPA